MPTCCRAGRRPRRPICDRALSEEVAGVLGEPLSAEHDVVAGGVEVAGAAPDRVVLVDDGRAGEVAGEVDRLGRGAHGVAGGQRDALALVDRAPTVPPDRLPGLTDRLEREGPGALDRRFGLADPHLGVLPVGDRGVPAASPLRRGQGDQFVERPAGDTEGEAHHHAGGEAVEAELQQGAGVTGWVEHRHGRVPFGDDQPVDDHVVAAGAAQPRRVPRVHDLGPGGRKVGEAPVRAPVGPYGHVLAVHHDDADLVPVGVQAAAVERPAPAHREAAVAGGPGPPQWREHAGGDGVGSGAEQLPGHVGLEPGEEQDRVADQHGPARRPVGPAELLDDLDDRGRIELVAAERARHRDAEQARRPEPFDQVGGHGAQGVTLSCPGRDLGDQLGRPPAQPSGHRPLVVCSVSLGAAGRRRSAVRDGGVGCVRRDPHGPTVAPRQCARAAIGLRRTLAQRCASPCWGRWRSRARRAPWRCRGARRASCSRSWRCPHRSRSRSTA